MDEARDAQATAFFPHRIEARIVDDDKLAGFVAPAEAEVLGSLQTAGAAGDRVVEQSNHLVAEVGIVDRAIAQLGKDHETPGIGFYHFVDDVLRACRPTCR